VGILASVRAQPAHWPRRESHNEAQSIVPNGPAEHLSNESHWPPDQVGSLGHGRQRPIRIPPWRLAGQFSGSRSPSGQASSPDPALQRAASRSAVRPPHLSKENIPCLRSAVALG